jgi:hypothetical protein
MKYLPLLLLCGILFATILLLAKLQDRDAPGSIVFYLWTLLAFHAIAAWGLQKDSFDSNFYRFLYAVAVWVTASAGIFASGVLSRVHSTVTAMIICSGAVIFASGMFWTFVTHLRADLSKGDLHPATYLVLLEATLLLLAGLIVLATLAANYSPAGTAIRAALGVYMTTKAIVLFGFAAGAIRNRSLWYSMNAWLPAIPGILAFGLLVVFLSRQQTESTRELDHECEMQISSITLVDDFVTSSSSLRRIP